MPDPRRTQLGGGASRGDFESRAITPTMARQLAENATASAIPVASQAEAEAGTVTDIRQWTPERIAQAAQALGGGSVDESIPYFLS